MSVGESNMKPTAQTSVRRIALSLATFIVLGIGFGVL